MVIIFRDLGSSKFWGFREPCKKVKNKFNKKYLYKKIIDEDFDNLQSTTYTFSEALYFLHVKNMADLDHNNHDNSIELEK